MIRWKQLGKYAFLFIFLLIALTHTFLFFYSYTNIITTILLYGSIWILLVKIFIKLRIYSFFNKVLLFLICFIPALFIADVGIRYLTKKYESYSESNGSSYYISTYRDNKVKWTFHKVFNINFDTYFMFHKANDTLTLSKEEFSTYLIFNSLGFRSPELDTLSNNYKVLALGDSFTEGIGSPIDSTWPHQLSKRISLELNREVSYFNGGLSGSEPFKNLYILEQLISKGYRPNLVVVLINSSDLMDYYIHGDEKRFQENFNGKYTLGPWWEPFYASSYIVRVLVSYFSQLDHALLTKEKKKEISQKAEKEIYKLLVNKYKPLTDSIGAKLAVFCIPLEYEIEENLYSKFNDLNRQNIVFKNFTPEIRDYLLDSNQNKVPIYWKLDLHLNPKGYSFLANLIYKELYTSQAIN